MADLCETHNDHPVPPPRHRHTSQEHRAARGKGWIFRPIGENPKTLASSASWKSKYVRGQFLTLFHVVVASGDRGHMG